MISLTYVAKRLFVPSAREVEVSLGSDDGFRLFLDGVEVAQNEVDRGLAADQDRATLELSAGDRFFDLEDDPLMEKGVKTPDGWVFNTFKGRVFRISYQGAFEIEELFTITDEEGLWRVGGMQPLTYHAGANLLLALMHQGGFFYSIIT